MEEVQDIIHKKIKETYKQIKKILNNHFKNLYFYISPEGYISCWIGNNSGKIGINLKYRINVGQILNHHWSYLAKLNNLVEPVIKQADKYFYCTECGKVKLKTEFGDSVFAGYYCKECAKKSEIASLIAESHKRGFYD